MLSRLTILALSCLGLSCLALLCLGANAQAANPRDGIWIIEGTTDQGECPKTFTGEIEVRGDDIVGAASLNNAPVQARVVGAIDKTNEIWSRLTGAAGVARGVGKIKGDAASGAWSSNTAYCGGRWKARRKK